MCECQASRGDATAGAHSRKRSAAEALETQVVRFPPAHCADVVLHYHNTAFHVHKFVLLYHSPVLRAAIELLANGPGEQCDDHPHIAHCIRLPVKCGKLGACADAFRKFLCHLYFARHHNCAPFPAKTQVDLSAEPAPAVSLECPKLADYNALAAASNVTGVFGANASPSDRAVVSLCHYFDCALVLARCEDNMLLLVERIQRSLRTVASFGVQIDGRNSHGRTMIEMALQFAANFDLLRLRKVCIPLVAENCVYTRQRNPAVDSKQQWDRLTYMLDRPTLVELMQEVCNRAPVRRPDVVLARPLQALARLV